MVVVHHTMRHAIDVPDMHELEDTGAGKELKDE